MKQTKSQQQNWRGTTLGEYLDFYNGKSIKPATQGKYPVYGSHGKIGGSDKSLYEHAVIIGRVGAYCGSVQYEEGKFWASDNTIVAKTKSKGGESFAYYLLGNLNLNNYAGGAAQPLVTQSLLKQISVFIPSQETQEQIADVLSAYDDLIENNTKRIKILEEIAQAIYREWFVYFRFPGHEKVKMIDSKTEFGKIPDGWVVKNLGDKINIFRGKNITKNTVTPGKVPVIAGGMGPAYFHNRANVEGPAITVSASGANSGYINLYHEDIWASDCSYINKNATPFVYYYFLLLKGRQAEVTGLQRGSAQPHVYPQDLARLLIVDPLEEIVRAFEDKAKSIFGMISNFQIQNQNLRQARDLLLPKLVTGEIQVQL